MARKRLGELLVMAGAIDEFQLQSALGEQRRWGRHLGATLVEMGLLDEITLVRTLSQQLNIPAVDLEKVSIEPTALRYLDYDLCSQYSCIPFRYEERGRFLYVAMTDPTNMEVYDRLRVHTRCNLRPHLAGPKAIEVMVRRKYLGETAKPAKMETRKPDEWLSRGEEPVFEFESRDTQTSPTTTPAEKSPAPKTDVAQQIKQMRTEIKELKALLHRDEMVLRKLMSLVVDKGLCSREELVARLHED
jgi:type IV pilus assembly protein PilB